MGKTTRTAWQIMQLRNEIESHHHPRMDVTVLSLDVGGESVIAHIERDGTWEIKNTVGGRAGALALRAVTDEAMARARRIA